MSLLDIRGLTVRYGQVAALDGVSLSVAPGEIVGLVGRSGSGKSTLAVAITALLPSAAHVAGRISIDGRDLSTLRAEELRTVRGGRVGTVFQDPATALTPTRTIGAQIGAVLAAHGWRDRRAIAEEARRLIARVGVEVTPDHYPHMLSGGQRQRSAIAAAIAARPALLVADEPTAALDPLAREGIAELLAALVRERGMGLLLVSHDLPLVARLADRIAVLDEGRLIEGGAALERLARPSSPVLAAMVAAESRPAPRRQPAPGAPLLKARDLVRRYRAAGLFSPRKLVALDGVSLEIAAGETLAVVGASGSGKTTLARLVLGLDRPDAGTVLIDGTGWDADRGRVRALRREVQAVFQDPADSLDPLMRVAEIVAEPLQLLNVPHKPAERARLVAEALAEVELDPAIAARRPRTFSGGQRQRIALARALVLRPRLVVLDEALSALDPELRVEMAALLGRLQAERGLSYLFISHDMALVRRVAHRVMVLRDGHVVEQGDVATVLDQPRDPYTAALVAAAPGVAEALVSRPGCAPSAPTIRA